MIVRVDDDEWFPCWSLSSYGGVEADVPEDVVERWKSVQSAWDDCQAEMAALSRWHGNWGHALEAMARGDS